MTEMLRIQPDFSKDSNFDEQSGISRVKFGADAPVLEVELNELQQIQDKAREDLIRSMIPSGFTKAPVISEELSEVTTLRLADDAEAYVNGMRICLPKGTSIDIGEPPEKEQREDLVFLEVWKEEVGGTSTLKQFGGESLPTIENKVIDNRTGEETSHRIVNRWRIRLITDLDFNSKWITASNHENAFLGWNDDRNFSKVYAKGANANLEKPTSISGEEIFRPACSNEGNTWYFNNDPTLWVAGIKNGASSLNRYKTIDGLVYAIPMFKLTRRPKQGVMKSDYNSLAFNVDPVKVSNITKLDKVSGVKTGELDFLVKGQTLKNLYAESNNVNGTSFDVSSLAVIRGLTETSSRGLKTLNQFKVGNTYTMVCYITTSNLNRKDNSTFYIECPLQYDDGTIVYPSALITSTTGGFETVKFKFNIDKPLSKLFPQIAGRNISGTISYLETLILEGDWTNRTTPGYFKGLCSTGEYQVAFREFVNYRCSAVQGQPNDCIAVFNYKPKSNYIKVRPVGLDGNEIGDSNIAFALLNTPDGETIRWQSTTAILITNDEKASANYIKMYGNEYSLTNDFLGFNIYDGYSVEFKSKAYGDKESKLTLVLDEPLRGIPNGLCDTITREGILNKRIKSIVLNGSENWVSQLISTDGNYITAQLYKTDLQRGVPCIADNFDFEYIYSDGHCTKLNREYIGIYNGAVESGEWLYISIKKTRLETPDISGIKKWLSANPTTVYFAEKREMKTLRNGVSDVDDNRGTITKYTKTITLNGTEDWRVDEGFTQKENLMRFIFTPSDRIDSVANNKELMDITSSYYETSIDTDNGGIPRFWGYYSRAIYLDVVPSTIGINFANDNDSTKVQKFKDWLKGLKPVISYQLSTPIKVSYPVSTIRMDGDLYLNSENVEISNNNTVSPILLLTHKADTALNLYSGENKISTDSGVPVTIGYKENKKESALNYTASEEILNAPITIEGNTLLNLAHISQLENMNTFKDGVLTLYANGGWNNKAYFDITPLKTNTTYTIFIDPLENTTSSADPTSWAVAFYLHQVTLDQAVEKSRVWWNPKDATSKQLTFTTQNDLTNQNDHLLWIEPQANATSGLFSCRVMILEGDWSNKPRPNFFQESMSVGERTNSLKIYNTQANPNILRGSQFLSAEYWGWNKGASLDTTKKTPNNNNSVFVNLSGNTSNVWAGVYGENYQEISVKEGQTFSLQWACYIPSNHGIDEGACCEIRCRDASGQRLKTFGADVDLTKVDQWQIIKCENCVMPKGVSTITVDCFITKNGRMWFGDPKLEYGSSCTMYQPHFEDLANCDKKPYKVDIKALNLSIKEGLKSLPDGTKDTIEYVDGIPYLIQRVGKVVLDHNFTWQPRDMARAENTIGFGTKGLKIDSNYCTVGSSNRFIVVAPDTLWNQDKEGMSFTDFIHVRIKKSKLPEVSLDGFKEWIKMNPITCYYKLKTPVRHSLVSMLETSNNIDTFNVAGQVDFKRTNNSGVRLNRLSLQPSQYMTSFQRGGLTRLYDYSLPSNENCNIQDLVGIPLVPNVGLNYAEKDFNQYFLTILEVLPNCRCKVECLSDNVGGQSLEYYTVPIQYSAKVKESDITNMYNKVSLTGYDYNQVLEETLSLLID